jgi:L-arabinose isomerase
LPLYLALYDKVVPQFRAGREAFARDLAERLRARGLEVELAPVCCVKGEVAQAVRLLEEKEVDLLATAHLAYSPSFEADDALRASKLPLALLDTTPTERFDSTATMDDMFANHGIHGVQDLACVLKRCDRGYHVLAGHVADEAFLDDVVLTAWAARAARAFRDCNVLLFGQPFEGMGDFAIELETLDQWHGLFPIEMGTEWLAACVAAVTDEELDAEEACDREWSDVSGVSREALRESNRVGLALRQLIETKEAGAFTMNFQAFDRAVGLPTVPFLEASKQMAWGVGYAGEGDVLTAGFLAALMAGFGDTTFTEMFCPDWAGNAIFMSHMGECNVAMAKERPRLVEKDYRFGNVCNPVIALMTLKPGPATLANVAPLGFGALSVTAARVEVLDRGLSPNFPDVPHFWIRPREGDIRDFLRRYSEAGGTHHLALLPGDHTEGLRRMAAMLALEFTSL